MSEDFNKIKIDAESLYEMREDFRLAVLSKKYEKDKMYKARVDACYSLLFNDNDFFDGLSEKLENSKKASHDINKDFEQEGSFNIKELF